MKRFVKDNDVDRRNIKLSARLTEESTCTLKDTVTFETALPWTLVC